MAQTSTIIQWANSAQQPILDIASPINSAYASKFGFQYQTDNTVRCADRPACWEKIAYINYFLPTVDDGSLVVWLDCDSLCIGNEDLHTALPSGGTLGMVQMLGGVGGRNLVNWYNSGTIVMINSAELREFWNNVFLLNKSNDEEAIMIALKNNMLNVSGARISSIDNKWNCWMNNIAFCSNPVIRTFHGIASANKVAEINAFIAQLPK